MFEKFWSWYERHYTLHVGIAAGLFLLQLIHLYWLTTDVVSFRLFGESFFTPGPIFKYLIIIVDYTEIPALISTSILYLNELRRRAKLKPLLFLLLINSQWLHLFWITDEFVVSQLVEGHSETVLPFWLAWIAILIDYLELPVIFDTIYKLIRSLREGNVKQALSEELRH